MYELLQEKAKIYPILYVEDNKGLRDKAVKFFKKFFDTVYVGCDGEEGFELFQKYQPQIVISDIKMPKLDGLQMTKKIKMINPNVKIILTTAFDDKEFLISAIEMGIFRYVNKPFNIKEITDILTQSIIEVETQQKLEIFNQNIQDIFNYQDNLLALISDDKVSIVNYNFLKFFGIEKAEDFNIKYRSFDNIFLEHENFISGKDTLKRIKENHTSLFNVKMRKENKDLHFILKVKKVPNEQNQYIFSLSDITELGLLGGFEKHQTEEVNNEKLLKLLQAIKDNDATIKVHNYYKGLSITNDAKILTVEKDVLKIQTNYLQGKAVLYEKIFIISSKFLPKNVLCQNILDVDYDSQSITAQNYKFMELSPTRRKFVRVRPEEEHKAVVFYNSRKYDAEMRDISVQGVRLRLTSIPAGLKKGDELGFSVLVKINKDDFTFKAKSNILRIDTFDKHIDIILLLDLPQSVKKSLINYISKRQLALIREFKGLNKEKLNV